MFRGLTPALQTNIPLGKWLHQHFRSRTRPGADTAPRHLYSRWRWHWAIIRDAHWVLEPQQHNYACPARTLRMFPPGWGESCKASPTMACHESRCSYLSTPWLKNNFPLLLNKLMFCWLEQPWAEGPCWRPPPEGWKQYLGTAGGTDHGLLACTYPPVSLFIPATVGEWQKWDQKKAQVTKTTWQKGVEDMGSKFKKRH